MLYDKFDVENASNNAYLDYEQYVDLDKTKCLQCEEGCEAYEYKRYNRKGDLQSFVYCKGNAVETLLSNWYIQKDGYACSTTPIKSHLDNGRKKKLLFHLLFKEDKTMVIDHINGIRNDNRLRNLREITNTCNNQNYHHKRSSIFPGVYWNRKRNMFVASCGNRRKDKNVYIGAFESELEAFHAYVGRLKEDGRTVNTQTEAYRKYEAWLGEKQQTTLI